MQSNSSSLLISPNSSHDEYIRMTPQSAGWDHLSFAARKMTQAGTWDFETHENELALVVLGGRCEVNSNRGIWTDVGRRRNVFDGMPYTLFFPPETSFTVRTTGDELD